MKGKISFKFKFAGVITLLLVFAFGLSFLCFKSSDNTKKVLAASKVSVETAEGNQEFSSMFEGNVLFSAEKVLMNDSIANSEDDDYNLDGANKVTFYERTEDEAGGEARDFFNYNRATNEKYVIGYGEFVMLENIMHSGGYYYNDSSSGMTEAIIISLGQYIYVPKTDSDLYDKVETASYGEAVDPKHAGITDLIVSLEHNGGTINLGGNRNIVADGGPYYDFMYVIPQKDGNEGFYRFSFSYLKGGRRYGGNFEFYLLFETSYSGKINSSDGNTYNIEPTLGWNEGTNNFEKDSKENGYVRYKIGESGVLYDAISYPTITYDYTRYSLKYTLVANGKNTAYVYEYVKGSSYDSIVYHKTTSLGTESITVPLSKRYDGDNKVVSNVVTIMLTEPGSYEFEFEYVYGGYNAESAPKMNLTFENKNLYIHGFDLLYSKHNYQSAQMKQYDISYNTNDLVDLIIPEGFNAKDLTTAGKDGKILTNYTNTNIGFIYTLNKDSTKRIGNIITNSTETHNTLLNASLKNPDTIAGDTHENNYDYLINELKNTTKVFSTEEEKTNLRNVLNTINYERTNQGYISFRMNEAFEDEEDGTPTIDSFYYFANSKLTDENILNNASKLKLQTFTNETSFNENGFYLVFMNVYPKGLKQADGETPYSYYQIFAFEYTTSTINIEAREDTVEKKIVPSFAYTNKSVEIKWQDPGVFDRAISAKYYTSYNKNDTIEDMLKGTSLPLGNGNKITNNRSGSFTKFLVEVNSEGKSATHYVFTIDNEAISGIGAYAVSQESIVNSDRKYYRFTINRENNPVNITNGIIDTFATLDWNDKGSGAQIYAEWSYTEFVDALTKPTSINKYAGEEYIATTYQLGSTISGVDIFKSAGKNYVEENNVLKGQGIYVFSLVDQAGNTAKYMLIIDKTENYFIVDNNGTKEFYSSGSSIMFGNSVDFTIGDYKTISLKDTDGNAQITNLRNVLNAADYYTGANSNKAAIQSLLKDIGDGVIAVRNTGIHYTNSNGNPINANSSIGDVFGTVGGTIGLDPNKSNRTVVMYVKGQNNEKNLDFEYSNSRSKLSVEINTDNAKGRVYFSNGEIATVPDNNLVGSNVSGVYNLDYDNKIIEAQATAAPYVCFAWNMGVGAYAVQEVKYQFYKLDLTASPDATACFYKPVGSEQIVYAAGSGFASELGAKEISGENRGVVHFGGQLGTDEGLYVVTRTYSNEFDAVVGSTDKKSLSYYFIVDRNGIIEGTEIGNSIEILFSDDTPYKEFNKYGLSSSTFKDGDETINFSTYLTTTKVPATLSIPVAKYITDKGNSSSYYAGRLSVRVFFIDKSNQLNSSYSNGAPAFKIYEDRITSYNANGYYSMDIASYLENKATLNNESRITTEINDGKWLYLPGTYVIVIKDNVFKNSLDTFNTKTFAFEIDRSDKPTVDFITGWEEDEAKLAKVETEKLNSGDVDYRITTSDEFVWFNLPGIKDNVTKYLQVDPDYLIVEQNFDGSRKYIINNPYTKVGTQGENIKNPSSNKIVVNTKEAGNKLVKRTIKLDTMLKDEGGNIKLDNLSKTLEYTITIRYKMPVSNETEADNYKGYLKYYDGNVKKYFYETKYKVIIDRLAPTNNLTNLTDGNSEHGIVKDGLIDEYEDYQHAEMFTEGYHNAGAKKIYFTQQYNKYYTLNNEDVSNLYILRVNKDNTETATEEKTYFDWTGLDYVLYRAIKNTTTEEFVQDLVLSLPITDISNYEKVRNTELVSYDRILPGSGYYEIVEVDKAGNQTQYVVYFVDTAETISNLSLTYSPLNGGEKVEDIISKNSLEFYSVDKNDEDVINGGYFYKVELKNSFETLFSKFTNVKYDFNKLDEDIVKMINDAGFGSYTLVIKSRFETKSITMGYYDKENIPSFNVDNFIGLNKIDISGPNVQDVYGNWRYAKEITIKTGSEEVVYTAEVIEGNKVVYSYQSGDESILTWGVNDNKTYRISGVDNFGEPFVKIYNTKGNQPIVVVTGSAENIVCYQAEDGTYYSFKDVEVRFDKTLFNIDGYSVSVNGAAAVMGSTDEFKENKVYEDDAVYYRFIILTKDTPSTNTYVIKFIDTAGSEAGEIKIVVDTHIADVTLRDAITNEDRNFIAKQNIKWQDLDKTENMSSDIIAGNVNLVFDLLEKPYFTYTTILREIETDPNGHDVSERVNIKDGGKYQLIISVYSAHQNAEERVFLGNFVYAMNVATQDMGLYEVVGFDEANSTFLYSEVNSLAYVTDGTINRADIPSYNLPLYISNVPVQISYYESLVIENGKGNARYEHSEINGDGQEIKYTFTIYRVAAANYEQYFGTLIVEKTMDLIKDVQVTKVGAKKTEYFKYIDTIKETETDVLNLTGTMENEFTFAATTVKQDADYLFNRNKLVLEVYYNDNSLLGSPVATYEFSRSTGISYTMVGSGDYSFVIKDLAGNIHYLNNKTYVEDESEDKGWADFEANYGIKVYRAYVYREAIVYVNNENSISNAYYNGMVEVGLYARARYVTGSISAYGTLNGNNLGLGTSSTYKFTKYGTYRIVFNARYDDGTEEGVPLTKVVMFTIINPKEARRSLDITNLNSYSILSVTNQFGTDVTEVFKSVLANKENSSKAISYEDLYNYSLIDNSKLEMFAGKQTYTITYEVQENDYPKQQVSFSFMLNNETPKIDCSLEPGKTTKKGFTFSFNPAIIYEQVGEAYVYINDELVMVIDENASSQTATISRTFKANGAGDYYIRLTNTSGTVWTSYKATIKEPLNAWAIIIIIVVVLVVGGVVTAIILLRHKMRIR